MTEPSPPAVLGGCESATVGMKQQPVISTLWPLYLVIFMGFIGYSLMITVFTPMMLRGTTPLLSGSAGHASRTIVLGILLCLYPLGQFLGSPILGALSDRFGRKPVLLASLAATTCCYAVIALSLSFANLFILGTGLLLAGLAEANVVIAQSAITDIVAAAERTRYFGYIYMSASLAYILGPLFGGKLADPQLGPWFSDATPFWIVFVLLVGTTVSIKLIFHETKAPDRQSEWRQWLSAFTSLSIVADRKLRRFFGLNFLAYLAVFGFFRSYPMYLVDHFHLGVSAVSEFVAWVGLPIVLVNLGVTGMLSARVSIRTLMIASTGVTGLSMLVLVLPQTERVLWPILFITGAALAVCLPSCSTRLSAAAEGMDQGRVMGSNQALQVGAEALSGLVGGLLAAALVTLPLLGFGSCAVAAAILVALMT